VVLSGGVDASLKRFQELNLGGNAVCRVATRRVKVDLIEAPWLDDKRKQSVIEDFYAV
jgi:hypothetical protein